MSKQFCRGSAAALVVQIELLVSSESLVVVWVFTKQDCAVAMPTVAITPANDLDVSVNFTPRHSPHC